MGPQPIGPGIYKESRIPWKKKSGRSYDSNIRRLLGGYENPRVVKNDRCFVQLAESMDLPEPSSRTREISAKLVRMPDC